MTSPLVRQLVARAGLVDLVAERAAGRVPDAAAWRGRLASADLLAVGAAADEARRAELGDEASIFVPHVPADLAATIFDARDARRGTRLLRAIATERLLGPRGARIVVDFAALGLEIAQVALSFGASDLAGPISSKRGLPLAEAEGAKQLVRKREIAEFVESARYRPVFVQAPRARAAEASARPSKEPA